MLLMNCMMSLAAASNGVVIFLMVCLALGLVVMLVVDKLGNKAEGAIRSKIKQAEAEHSAELEQQIGWQCPLCGKPQTVRAEYCRHCGTHR